MNEPSTSGWSNLCTSSCDGNDIIGGYGCYGSGASTSKTFTITKTHYQVSVSFEAYWIDSWDSENLLLWVDGTLRFAESKPGTMGQLCGVNVNWLDYYATRSTGAFSHTSSSITLKFNSTLDQGSTDESWGFRNIKITVWPVCYTGCSACTGNSATECTACSNGYYLKGTTCVTECGAYLWENSTGNVCSRNFFSIFNFHYNIVF